MNENEQSAEQPSAPTPQPAEKGTSKKSPLIIGIIVIVIVVLGFWWLGNDDSDSDLDEATEIEDAQGIDDAIEGLLEDEEDDDAALPAQPAPAAPATDPATDAAAPTVTTIALTGTNFAFSQEEIRVKQGDTVRIEFESTEGFHDWVVDEFAAATAQVRPGTPTSVEFVANQAGTFEYYCSVGTHRQQGMVGNLIVE